MRSGFTIIELLVVVSVIALLAALLLGGVAIIRSSAQTTACASNLHQFGVMFEGYATDKEGCYPPAFLNVNLPWLGATSAACMGPHGYSDMGTNWHTWFNYLGPYAPADTDGFNHQRIPPRLARCPASPFRISDYTTAEGGPLSAWYGINTAYLGTHAGNPASVGLGGILANANRGQPGWPGYGVGSTTVLDNARSTAAIRHPSRTIQIAEHWGGRSNAATGLKMRVFWTDPPFVRPPVDEAGVVIAPPSGATAAAPFPWSGDGFEGWAVRASHRGRTNLLYVDGHVDAQRPWDLCPDGTAASAGPWTGY